MLDNTSSNSPSDIAIVGMALRVPGARTVNEFWNNLRSGTESIRTLTTEELVDAGETAERMHHPRYVARTADLSGMEMFDADFFGLGPKEAAIMDPQHRHFLECVWEAMEDAGSMPETLDGPVGVFAGCGMGSYFYFNVCSNRALVDQVGMFLLRHTGNDKDFLATRASFALDLRGPSVNVQTACSTSLVAIHYACQSLLNGECEMALAGGVTIELPHRRGYLYEEGEILAPDGHCRPFDHRAAGTVFGSGVGVVALKRLSDALEAGDPIHAVIKATAINNDGGSKAGYLAPSVSGQAEAIVEAQGLAGVSADSIQYVECHGTGTALGDPIEIEALTSAFRQSTDRNGFCRVGSVKSNIGHLDTAAGVVSIIKTALAIKHGEMPPTLGFERPNPAIDFASSPFAVCNELTPWPPVHGRRRAAVNSLGVGGTNAHAILEQAPHRSESGRGTGGPVLLSLSARKPAALDQSASALSQWLATHPRASLDEVAHSLWTGRRRFEHNRLVAVRDRDDAIAALADKKRGAAQVKLESSTGAVFLFPGGGAQHHGMASSLYRNDNFFRAIVDEGLSYLPDEAEREIRAAWFSADRLADGSDPLLKPSVQLPAILIVEVAIARLWMRAGVMPSALIGHSMGENAAACVAGVFDFRDAVRLVRLRGELFDTVPLGGMLGVPLSGDELRAILPDNLDIASLNAPAFSVVSGSDEDLKAFASTLEAREISPSRIPISIAAHSRMLDGILPRWEAFLRSLTLRAPNLPIVSNLSGDWLTAEQATDPLYWVRHLRSTVLFADCMAKLTADASRVYIDVGPGKTLASLAKAQGSISANQVINSLPHPEETNADDLHFLSALGRATLCGLSVESSMFWGGGRPRREALPTYPFQHKRYFIEPATPASRQNNDSVLAKQADMALWGYRPIWKQSLPDYEPGAEESPLTWLVFLDKKGVGSGIVARLRKLGHEVTTVAQGDGFVRRSPSDYVVCPELAETGYQELFRGLAADARLPSRIVHAWLLDSQKNARPGSSTFHWNLDCGFQSLFHLAKALGSADSAEPLHITVLADGMLRVAGEAVPYPEKATALGPGLVLPREIPGVSVRVIDMEAERPSAQPKRWTLRRTNGDMTGAYMNDGLLWNDLFGEARTEVVAYRDAKRWTRSYGTARFDQLERGKALLRQGGTYLFTGGLGDIALSLAGDLASRFGARLVLVGRTELPPREHWLGYRRQNRADAVVRGIDAILDLEARGAEVLYCRADVTDPQEMSAALAAATARFGRVNGVFHTAGTVDDGLMETKSVEQVNAVLAPKLLGTRVLDEVLQNFDIDLLVLFSSTSTATAPAGQADYVAANAYLDAYADSCASRTDRKTVALHWGIWNETGLAARGTGTKVAAAPSQASEPATGPFYRAWQQDEDGALWLEAEIGPESHWVLDEHRLVSGEAVLPGTAYFDVIAQAAREHGIGSAFLVKDLVFLRPLVVADKTTKLVQTNFQRTERGWRVSIRAGTAGNAESFVKHAEADLESIAQCAQKRIDVAALRQSLPAPLAAEENQNLASAQEHHIRFGQRWQILRAASFGKTEALADIVLRPEHRADLTRDTAVHPALLDIATGFAMPLAEAFRTSDVLWAPASYGSVRLYGVLPERIVSHVSLVPSHDYGADYLAFNITVADQAGKVVFEAERFLMKKLAGDSAFLDASLPAKAAKEAMPAPSPAMLRLAAQVRQGIRPAEGMDALLRALGSGLAQPIVSSIDLPTLCAMAAAGPERRKEKSAAFERPDVASDFVAPRDTVEAKLAEFWQDLLGVSRVGMEDSFFDLGGHSLIAVRLFRMIKKEWGIDLPISTLFSAPTVGQCASMLREMAPITDDKGAVASATPMTRHMHLTMMHPGRNPDAVPIFICAGMFGNILNLRTLALHLGIDRPVYGLQARGLYGDAAPHETFEEMAADYLAEIRSIQPHGPYLLAGYSGGGITAFEMARQLRASGEHVPHIIMLDTPVPVPNPLSFADKLSMKSQDLRRQHLGLLKSWLAQRAAWSAELRRKRDALSEPTKAVAERFDNDRIESAFRRALGRYAIMHAEGPVTVYRPQPEVHYHLSGQRRLMANRNLILDDNGWGVHVDELHITEVPGNHDTMVLEPHVRVLAGKIRRELSAALRPAAPASTVTLPTRSAEERLAPMSS